VNEQQFRVRLEALGAGPPTPDWAGVRRRVERLRRRRTRLAVALAATALLVAVPAIAVATGEIDFWSAEPAGPRAELIFREMDRRRPPGAAPMGITDARKILTRTFRSGLLTRGTWTLTVGLRKDGGFCTFLEGPRGGGAQCASAPPGGLSLSGGSVDKLNDAVAYGAVDHPDAAYVELRFRGGRVKRTELTWVSQPIGAAFFMEQVPVWGKLRYVVVRDADGNRLASSKLWFEPQP
jgi:hypothetical protein